MSEKGEHIYGRLYHNIGEKNYCDKNEPTSEEIIRCEGWVGLERNVFQLHTRLSLSCLLLRNLRTSMM